MLHSAIRATLWREWMSSQRIWLQQPVTADLKLFPDVKWLMSVVGQNANWCHLAARQLISQKQTSADTMRRSATGQYRTQSMQREAYSITSRARPILRAPRNLHKAASAGSAGGIPAAARDRHRSR